MTPEQVKESESKELRVSEDERHDLLDWKTIVYRVTLGKEPFWLAYVFRTNQLSWAIYTLAVDQKESRDNYATHLELKSLLNAKYGQPYLDEERWRDQTAKREAMRPGWGKNEALERGELSLVVWWSVTNNQITLDCSRHDEFPRRSRPLTTKEQGHLLEAKAFLAALQGRQAGSQSERAESLKGPLIHSITYSADEIDAEGMLNHL